MKKIALSQLKTEVFNPTSIIEGAVDIRPNNPDENLRQMKDVLADLESLNEALFFKMEKLKKNLGAYDRNKYVEIIKSIEGFVERLKIPSLGDSRHILEKNKEILELKQMQKYLRYTVEIGNNGRQVLDALLGSELKDDWLFLAELLHYSIKYAREEDKEMYITYSKRIEEKMVRVFQESQRSKDLLTCRAAFNCLAQLDKETLLLDEYMLGNDIFAGRVDVTPPLATTVDLDEFKLKEDTFEAFVRRIADGIEGGTLEFHAIFGSTPRHNDYLYGKLYRMVVFRNLERFLSVANPILFLLCFSSSYASLEELGQLIQQHYPHFEPDVYMNEGFSQYFSKAVQKEKQFFDEVFNILIYDAKTVNSYILLGEPLECTPDFELAYKKLLCIVDLMEQRSKLFYDAADEKELLQYFYRKMGILVENIVIKTESKIATITTLTRLFLLTRKFFGEKFHLVDVFVKKIDESIQTAFADKIESSDQAIKAKTANLYFLKKSGHAPLLNLVKACVSDGEPLKGKNYEAYANAVLGGAYERLYKQIFTIVYTEEQGRHLLCCVDDFLGYISLTNRMEMVRKFSHLREICRLITVEPEFFVSMHEEFGDSITDKELGDLIKCRKDKDEIRAKLHKLKNN